MFVDSHCHLNFDKLYHDIDNVIDRAKVAGVNKILCIATNKSNFLSVIDIANSYDNIWCTIGIHPHSVSDDKVELNDIINLLEEPKVVGIGETGLDYHYNLSPKDLQIESFKMHCEIAKISNLPLVIHNRLSEIDILNILTDEKRKNPDLKGVIHCFSSNLDFATKCIDLGFLISFSGIITFKNASELRTTVENIPLDKVLIETDAPYLAPVPYRGKTNEPSYVIETAKQLSNIHSISIEEVANVTTDNFHRLFNRIPN